MVDKILADISLSHKRQRYNRLISVGKQHSILDMREYLLFIVTSIFQQLSQL